MPEDEIAPAQDDVSAAKDRASPPPGLRARGLKRVGSAWRTIGTAITGIAVALALTFTLWPGLLPDPRANLSATMEVQKLETGVRYGQFLGRIHEPTRGLEADVVCQVGTVVYVKIGVEGRKHGDLSLEQWLHTSDGRRAPYQEAASAEDSSFKPDTPSDRWVQPVWISTIGYEDVYARLELYDGRTMLAMVETKPLPKPPQLPKIKLCP